MYCTSSKCLFIYIFLSLCCIVGCSCCCYRLGMDREWILSNRLSVQYQDGVDKFIETAIEHAAKSNVDRIFCPCGRWFNSAKLMPRVVRSHLFEYGFDSSYSCRFGMGKKSDRKITYKKKLRNNLKKMWN